MKKNKLMSLMTALLILLGFTATHAQITEGPITYSTLTRYSCIPGYLGCVADPVTVILSANLTGLGSTTQSFGPTTALTFNSNKNYIKVNGSAYFALPTIANPTVIINSTDGIFPYTVTLNLTGTRTYTITVSRISE
jgi:hypothetical protein